MNNNMKSIISVRQRESLEQTNERDRILLGIVVNREKAFLFSYLFQLFLHTATLSSKTMSMLWLVLCFVVQISPIASNKTVHHLIEFPAETLLKLRIQRDRSPNSISYLDFELLNEYQCAIECVKEKAVCTGYTYDASTKVCSLFDDPSRTVDTDVLALVSDFIRCSDDVSSLLEETAHNEFLLRCSMQTRCHLHGASD